MVGFASRHIARKTLQRYGYLESYPVDIFRLCSDLGIEVERVNCRALHGLSINYLGEKKIYYSRNLGKCRQRFTIAHELGHLLLGHEGIHFDQDRAEITRLERQANQFAAEILVPKISLSRIWMKYTPTALANIYQVSRECMILRLNELGCLHRVKI